MNRCKIFNNSIVILLVVIIIIVFVMAVVAILLISMALVTVDPQYLPMICFLLKNEQGSPWRHRQYHRLKIPRQRIMN